MAVVDRDIYDTGVVPFELAHYANALIGAVLQRTDAPVLLLDRRLAIVYVAPQAEAVLRDGRHIARRADGHLLCSSASHSSSRQVVVGQNKENATASFASWFINPSLGLSIPVMSDDTSEINVAASASYIYGGVGSYTESSANFTAAVGAVPISVFEARLELNGEKIIAPTAHGDVRIRGKVGVLAEANMGSSNIPLTLNGTATTFANPGTTTYGAYAGAGLSADIGSGLVLDAGLDLVARADGNNAASGKLSLIGSF